MIQIKVPPLGESIVEATVLRWLKQVGERVAAGETIVELETDKVTVEVPAMRAGVLVKQLHRVGDVVSVGAVLAELEESEVATEQVVAGAPAADAAGGTATVAPTPATVHAAEPEPSHRASSEVRAAPSARRLAEEAGLNLGAVRGTGLGGVVSKTDVVEHLRAAPLAEPEQVSHIQPPSAPPAPAVTPITPPAASPVEAAEVAVEVPPAEERVAQPPPIPPAAPSVPTTPHVAPPLPPPAPISQQPSAPPAGVRETRERMSTRRRRIAEHLLEAQHATAHLTTFNEIDMSAVESFRLRIRERIEKEHGVRLTFMPFFVRAACTALKQFPVLNARVDGDFIVYHHYVNMGIAVAAEGGLVVPTIKDADRKGLLQIAREMADLARAARDGKLKLDDLTGGTFTITNGGVFGSLLSTPILNYPQSAILGLHKIQERPVASNGQVVIRPMMYVALSYDHRIIDGEQAVRFLVRIKELMEDPALMVLD